MNTTAQTIPLDNDTHTVAGWIWNNLVPKSGQASSVQGELLLAVEKLDWEARNNGNGNWDKGFETLLMFLRTTLGQEIRLPIQMRNAVQEDLNTLAKYKSPYLEDDLYDRLTEAVVAYCRLNPTVIPKPIDAGLLR